MRVEKKTNGSSSSILEDFVRVDIGDKSVPVVYILNNSFRTMLFTSAIKKILRASTYRATWYGEHTFLSLY